MIAGSDTVGLWEIPAEGGEGRVLLPIDPEREVDFHELGLLPEGRGFLFTVHGPSGHTSIDLLAEGTRRELVAPTTEDLRYPVYSPTGHLVFLHATALDRLLEATSAPRRSGTGPPNVLLLTVDTLRADRLHAYGSLALLRRRR